jgi:hypothetical protein
MELLITVKTLLSEHQYTIESDLDIELPYAEYIQKLGIEKHLDKNYSGWVDYEIDLLEIPKREWELALEEKQDVEKNIAQFDNN